VFGLLSPCSVLVHLRKLETLKWEGLIVHDMPVEYVKLSVRHGIYVFQYDFNGVVVSGRVDHEASVLEAREICDLGLFDLLVCIRFVLLDQLTEGFQTPQGSPHRVGCQHCAVCVDIQRLGFVAVQSQLRLSLLHIYL
jgi:hypothetical protein